MLYIHTDPACPQDSRSFLYHLATHTLAEHFITAAGNHHLRIHQDGEADTETLLDMMEFLEARSDYTPKQALPPLPCGSPWVSSRWIWRRRCSTVSIRSIGSTRV